MVSQAGSRSRSRCPDSQHTEITAKHPTTFPATTYDRAAVQRTLVTTSDDHNRTHSLAVEPGCETSLLIQNACKPRHTKKKKEKKREKKETQHNETRASCQETKTKSQRAHLSFPTADALAGTALGPAEPLAALFDPRPPPFDASELMLPWMSRSTTSTSCKRG